ncbi:hypothetical protein SH661x_001242 [Planctomicrobium sp. SH661]|uniref:hypothetical protein n=1 Tax=Planctomicrobium sp. SH661 TaxID=3448124 RepID=UPI003F5B7FB2
MHRNPSTATTRWRTVLTFMAAGFITPIAIADQKPSADETHVKVTFSGGHETEGVDRGRPVNLIAGALGVKPEVFRKAFSGVRPAAGGRPPEAAQVHQNKAVLMRALGPLGVTNDRLDAVSNYYRIRPGEMWPTQPAEAVAIVKNEEIVRFEVTKGGSGYCSQPKISVPGHKVPPVQIELSFGPKFEENGAISAINIQK